MEQNNIRTAILLLSCKDQKGLVFKITNFIFKIGGNIIDLDEHVDPVESLFFTRVAFELENGEQSEEKLNQDFKKLGEEIEADWKIKFEDTPQNVAIFVSKYDHCLLDILWRNSLNEFNINISAIVSNHNELKYIADQYKIPFHLFEISNQTKVLEERKQLDLLSKLKVDTIVLARYMQILTPEFVKIYKNRIINIHHSFLPAFIGGNPYKQAFNRGVKIIGATSHYVTDELDEGPIIEQDIIRITHRDSLKDLIRKGRDLERLVLARAILLHSQHKILVFGRKTIIFN
jgi:formyltetrahydrofolate deformylase